MDPIRHRPRGAFLARLGRLVCGRAWRLPWLLTAWAAASLTTLAPIDGQAAAGRKRVRATATASAVTGDRVGTKAADGQEGKPIHGDTAIWTVLSEAARLVRVGAIRDAAAPLQRLVDGWPGAPGKEALPKLASEALAVARYLQARVLAADGQGDAAAKALAAARAIEPLAPAAFRFVEVEVAMARGDHAGAYRTLGELRKRWPKFRWAKADLTWSRLAERVAPPPQAAEDALDLYGKSHLHLPQDELLARAARLYHKAGNLERGHHLWRRLLMRHPESDFVEEATRHIALDSLSRADRLDRAELLFKRRDYERCRTECQWLWDQQHRRDICGYLLGKIGSERLRDDYPAAAKAFEAAIAPGAPYALQALSSYAIVLAKLGRIDDAVAAFDRWMERYRTSAPIERVNELMYDRCRSIHIAGQSVRAAREYEAFLEGHRSGFDWGKYWWFVGFWYYQGGEYDKALAAMSTLRGSGNAVVGGKARYWIGKAKEKKGDLAGATREMTSLLVAFPLSWYSGLAENWLEDHGLGSKIPKRPDLSKIPERAARPFAHLPHQGAVQQLRMVAHLGEYDTLRGAFDDLRGGVVAQIGAAATDLLEEGLGDAMEDVAGARGAALARHGGVLRRWPDATTVHQWRAIYPRAYATHSAWAARKFGAPEWMVYAHMLQESRYKPWMISGAPAFGLLELLDRTARRIAGELKEDYQLWMLMVPGPNIRWGAQYLGALLAKFHGQLPFAIASYNAGPMLMEYHMKVSDGKDLDLMIDDLGPHECRNYVRMVTGHFLRYLAIYEKPAEAKRLRAALLPRTWQAKWLPQPNY